MIKTYDQVIREAVKKGKEERKNSPRSAADIVIIPTARVKADGTLEFYKNPSAHKRKQNL